MSSRSADARHVAGADLVRAWSRRRPGSPPGRAGDTIEPIGRITRVNGGALVMSTAVATEARQDLHPQHRGRAVVMKEGREIKRPE
jgi:hypothetical protein